MSNLFAHTRNEQGEWHLLVDHLTCVANKALKNAEYFGLETPAFWIGLWHDLGKANPAFQDYLKAADQGNSAVSVSHALGEPPCCLYSFADNNKTICGKTWPCRLQDMSAPTAMPPASPLSELTTFYRVMADDEQLDELAQKLLNLDLVEGAYVKPRMRPPVVRAMQPPAPQEAPPVTPNLVAQQLYLEAAPGGIDARFAWLRPGGKGKGVRIIDIEGAWRFSHEDLMQNQGGVMAACSRTTSSGAITALP